MTKCSDDYFLKKCVPDAIGQETRTFGTGKRGKMEGGGILRAGGTARERADIREGTGRGSEGAGAFFLNRPGGMEREGRGHCSSPPCNRTLYIICHVACHTHQARWRESDSLPKSRRHGVSREGCMNFPRFPSKTYRRRIEGWGRHGEGESKARVSIVSIAASRMRTLEQEEGRPASGPGVSGACVSGGMGTRQEGMSSWRNACLSLELFFILVAGTDMLPDSAMETGKTVFTDGYHRSSMRMRTGLY